MSDHKTNHAMLPPDPDGHNRALDRVAAEHLRAVAPHLAPCLSCQARLCAEHGPTVTATTTTMGECSPVHEGCKPACECQRTSAPVVVKIDDAAGPDVIAEAVIEIRKHPVGPLCVKCGQTETARGGDLHCQGDCDDAWHNEPDGCHHFTAPPAPEPTWECHRSRNTSNRSDCSLCRARINRAHEAAGIRERLGRTDQYVPDKRCATAPPQPEPTGIRAQLGRTSRYVPECETCKSGAERCPEHGLVRYGTPPAPEAADEMSAEAYLGLVLSLVGKVHDGTRAQLLAHDAALRASREAKRQRADRAERLIAGVQPDERATLAVNILRVWPRVEIETFARHLLGTRSPEEESLLVGQLMTQVQIRDRQLADQRLTIDHRERERDEAREALVWQKNLTETGNECMRQLKSQRDEAREQREDLANEILAERSDLAAANARAEEAERDTRTAAEACDEALRQRDTERAARVAAETEREAYRQDRDLTAHRLAAAEAEVKRLNDVVDEHAGAAMRAGLERDRAVSNAALDARRMMEGHLTEATALRARAQRLVKAGDALLALTRRFRSTAFDGSAIDALINDWLAVKEQK